MLKLSDENRIAFADAVAVARPLAGLVEAVRSIYSAFEQERRARAPRCDQSGQCCRFEAYGHRLFVTTVEVAAFAEELERSPVEGVPNWDGAGCVYQVDGLCAAHKARPFGCRVYFCDPTSTDWQHEQYERFHAALRELHERFGVGYWYVEWREALSVLPRPVLRERVGARVRLSVLEDKQLSP